MPIVIPSYVLATGSLAISTPLKAPDRTLSAAMIPDVFPSLYTSEDAVRFIATNRA